MRDEREGPDGPEVDPDLIAPLAAERDPEVKKGRRGDPEDSSLEPSDQSNEAGDYDDDQDAGGPR